MLLRRLGLTLKAHGADGEAPLAHVTAVATSATLGDHADPAEMVDFAELVFGTPFETESVVTESRLQIDEWAAAAVATVTSRGLVPETGPDLVSEVLDATRALGPDPEAAEVARAVVDHLYEGDAAGVSDADLLLAHPLTHQLLESCVDATDLRVLAASVLGSGGVSVQDVTEFLSTYAGALSHVRFTDGRNLPSVEVHLWVRELTRIDREAVTADPTFWWSDDGSAPLGVDDDEQARGSTFPAIFCRHCGRSGWGVALSPADASSLDTSDTNIRRDHASKQGRFRPLLLASREGDSALSGGEDEPGTTSLRWFDVARRELLSQATDRRGGTPRRLGDPRPHPRRRRGRRIGTQGQLPGLPAAGRDPLPRLRRCHPAVGGAVDALRQHEPRPVGEKDPGLHRQRPGRGPPRRVRAKPLAQPHREVDAAPGRRRPGH